MGSLKVVAAALAAILCFGILTIWIEDRCAWGAFQVTVFLLAGWWLLQGRRFSIRLAPAALAAAAAAPFVQIAAGTTVSPAETWTQGLNWCTFALVFVLSMELLAEETLRQWFLRFIAGFGTILAFLSTLQNYTSQGKVLWLFPTAYVVDVFGPFFNHNQFAAWVELLFPVALFLAIDDRRFRTLHGSAAAVLFSSVVASTSRAGFVLICGETLGVLAAAAARRAAPRRALVLAAVQFLVLALVAAGIVGWERLEDRLQSGRSDLVRLEVVRLEVVRLDAVRSSVAMVRNRPWTGSGLGTWSMVYPRYAGFDAGVYVNQAHNDWLQWAAEGGLPFAFLLAIFGGLLCKPALQSIYGLGTVAFLLHALVDYPMQQRPALAAWFFAVAGAAFAGQRRRRNRNA